MRERVTFRLLVCSDGTVFACLFEREHVHFFFSMSCDKHRLNCGESLKNSVMQKPSPDGDEASVQSVASFGRAFSSENVSYGS